MAEGTIPLLAMAVQVAVHLVKVVQAAGQVAPERKLVAQDTLRVRHCKVRNPQLQMAGAVVVAAVAITAAALAGTDLLLIQAAAAALGTTTQH